MPSTTARVTAAALKRTLRPLITCSSGLSYCVERRWNPDKIWNECRRPDWMAWYFCRAPLVETTLQPLVAAALELLDLWRDPRRGRPPLPTAFRPAIDALRAWSCNTAAWQEVVDVCTPHVLGTESYRVDLRERDCWTLCRAVVRLSTCRVAMFGLALHDLWTDYWSTPGEHSEYTAARFCTVIRSHLPRIPALATPAG